MKYLIASLILLSSCSKNNNLVETQPQSIYYVISEVDKNGETTKTQIEHINLVTTNSAVEGDSTGGQNCPHHPLPISITSFNVTLSKSNLINISWTSLTEDNVDHYEIEKSLDSKKWDKLVNIIPNGGTYSYIDKY